MRAGSIDADPCKCGRVSQAARSVPLQTPADRFTDVIRQDDPAHCADGGVTSAQFAPVVDSVQWRELDIAASVNDRARQHIHR